jgi:hypothetical protein
MAIQIESRAPSVDFRCRTCDGEGEIPGAVACSIGCTCQGQVCGHEWGECPECDGKGVQPCAFCDEEPASEVGDDGDLICSGCRWGTEPDDDTEPSDPVDTDSYRMMEEFYRERSR